MPVLVRAAALAAVALAATSAVAQAPAKQAPPPKLAAVDQIASAVLPLPAEWRATAAVLGYGADGRLTTLRAGTGQFNCLAPDPAREQFHVACYHTSMEPFMARGRSLRASGTTGDRVDTVRFAEIKSGKLKMPSHPAALYTLTGGAYDATTKSAPGAQPLYVIYIPYATEASTGITTKPAEATPWIMYPGTPKAHIMLVPKM